MVIVLYSGIFQRVIKSILQGIDGIVVYLDDIVLTGSSEESHLKTLDEVLSYNALAWAGGSFVTPDARWIRETNLVCFTHPPSSLAKLLVTQERGIIVCLWNKEIPPMCLVDLSS